MSEHKHHAEHDAPQMEMPRYRSHKRVWALKIRAVSGRLVAFEDRRFTPIECPAEMFARGVPKPGDYLVQYEGDGYRSFSPGKAFEEGYTALDAFDRPASEHKQHAGLPVAGYQPQSEAKLAAVNAAKELEERCLRHLDAMAADTEAKHDPRMIALARTGIQEAWMWANRAVFQPSRVRLPEDGK